MSYRNTSIFTILVSFSMLSGCFGTSEGATAETPLRQNGIESSFDEGAVMRAAHAILVGKQAEKNADANALRIAAETLEGVGAKPEKDQRDDLSRRWSEQAKLIDPSITLPVYRGRALGPSYYKGVLSPVSSTSTSQIFLAGKKASVALVPVSNKPMSINIYDGRGKNICTRSTELKPANCQWLPLYTERYRIDINTSANQSVTYYLVSN